MRCVQEKRRSLETRLYRLSVMEEREEQLKEQVEQRAEHISCLADQLTVSSQRRHRKTDPPSTPLSVARVFCQLERSKKENTIWHQFINFIYIYIYKLFSWLSTWVYADIEGVCSVVPGECLVCTPAVEVNVRLV